MQMKNNAVPNQEPQATAEPKPMESSNFSNQAFQLTNEANPVELVEDKLEDVNGGVQAGIFLKPSTGEFHDVPKPDSQIEISPAGSPQTWL